MRQIREYLSEAGPFLVILYLALMGMMCVEAVQLYIGQPMRLTVGLVFMGVVFGIYVFNRFTDITEDFANDVGKYLFFSKRRVLYRGAVLALVAVLATLAALQKLRAYHVLLVALGILYSYKLVPWYRPGRGLTFHRIKELPLVKNILVSTLWGSAIFGIPMLFAGLRFPGAADTFVLVGVITVSTFNNTLFCDIRDERGDRLAGNKTVPVLWGVRATYGIMACTSVSWAAVVAAAALLRLCSAGQVVFALCMSLYPLFYVLYYRKSAHSKALLDFACESDLLLFAIGLTVLSAISTT